MYKKVMVPLDGSELAECVLPHMESIAKGCGVGEVILVRAVEPAYLPVGTGGDGPIFTEEDAEKARVQIDNRAKTEAKDYLDQVASRVKLGGAKVRVEVIAGKADESLADYAAHSDVDLIIIATHGRSGISRWFMGSVADKILRSSSVPVLMVRAPGSVSVI